MRVFEFVVTEESGIHARPAGLIAAEMRKYDGEVIIEKDGRAADAKKLFQIMGLQIKVGDSVKVSFSGENEDENIIKIRKYLTENF